GLGNNGRRAGGDCLLDVLAPVGADARAGEKHIAGLDLARVEAQIRLALHALIEPGKNVDHIHRVAASASATATRESTGASGCTPNRRKVLETISETTGAATRPP